MTRYYGSASRYLGPYSYYLLLSIDLPRLLLPRVILVTDFRPQSPVHSVRLVLLVVSSLSPNPYLRRSSALSFLLRRYLRPTPISFGDSLYPSSKVLGHTRIRGAAHELKPKSLLPPT